MQNYSIPVRFEDLLVPGNRKLARCTTEEISIKQNLLTILLTTLGEHRYAPEDFGCELWNRDFQDYPHKLEARSILIQEKLLKTFEKFEHRLQHIEINFVITPIGDWQGQEEMYMNRGKLRVEISGKFKSTQDPFPNGGNAYVIELYYGPKSIAKI